MEMVSVENIDELIKAQTQIWSTSLCFIKSMCLKCAVELGIPDIINSHGQPISLSDLVASLPIQSTKTDHVFRLMRILVHSGFFSIETSAEKNNQEQYRLTPASRLLLESTSLGYGEFVSLVLDPVIMQPFEHMSTWLKSDDLNPFITVNGKTLWEKASHEPRLNNLFNDCMAADSGLVAKMVMIKCKEVFEGIDSLVDVAGGTGNMARAIAENFPDMSCTVLDLAQVVNADLETRNNLDFVIGDMFQAVPPADAILLKWILHDWSDQECVKILKNCKDAIAKRKGKQGKIIIIEVVMRNKTWDDNDWSEAQMLFDMEMMGCMVGKERTEKEWAKLFFDSGFIQYKIHPILGPRALIELFP
ncbi:probable O-methyltransferase 3 [Euphorbia lathyris]|uniref:probable O-methyltransferase 3 n=1 Tax=Euphorbia lathyris TaxID=212925 RepID=UPI0033134588